MKTIINGKVYDTETANFVGRWTNGVCKENLEWYSEALYQNSSVEFFMYAVGSCRSKYAKKIGDNWTTGRQIIPLTYEAAKEWAEEHLTAGEYAEAFLFVHGFWEKSRYTT